MTPSALEALDTTRGAETHALAALRAQEADVNRLRAQAHTAREEADREREAGKVADTADFLLGLDVTERPDPGAKAERQAVIADRAADLREAERPTLLAAVKGAEEAVKRAAVIAYVAQRGAAQAEALAALQGLVGPLAALLAAEQVRATLAPAPFTVPNGVDPQELWSASFAVNALLSAIPPRLRPPEFAERVQAEAHRLAAETLNATGGEHG